MIEEYFLIGSGWSGWLRYYPNETYHFVVHSCSNDHAEDIQLLKTSDEVEQYMDELDHQFCDFPEVAEINEATLEVTGDILNGE